MSTVTRVLAVVAVAISLVLIVAAPAWATHVVQWGIDRADGPRTATVEMGEPVTFVVSVSLDGNPLAGWPMTARVLAAGELVQTIALATDGSGNGEFVVDGAPVGEDWIVELCDDDGCGYGTATITGSAAAPSTAETPGDANTTLTAPAATIVDAASPAGSSRDGTGFPWAPVIASALALVLVLALLVTRSRRSS